MNKLKMIIFIFLLSLTSCKEVQNNKKLSTNNNNPSLFQQIINYIENVSAIDFSHGTSDSGKIVKLSSGGLIDPSMLPISPSVNLSYLLGCAFGPLTSSPDILFTRVNKSDIFQIPGQGLKVSRIASSNSSGSFFGNGIGNKAFLGIASIHGTKVSDFNSFKITMKHLDNSFVYVNLLVDMDGDFATAEDRIAITIDGFGSAFNFTTMSTVELKPNDAIWWLSALGTVAESSTGLHLQFTGPTKTLDDFKSLNPNARFYTGVFFDGGYPKSCPAPAVNLSFGNSSNSDHHTSLVESMEWNGTYYDFK